MAAKHQKIEITVSKKLGPRDRLLLGSDIIDYIVERTRSKNVDKSGAQFPGYSKAYKSSLDFKIAGKSPGKVDLTLSGDMLEGLEVLKHKEGKIVIGYKAGSEENAKADGNIRGTYGKERGSKKKARDFLGFKGAELNELNRIKKNRMKALGEEPETLLFLSNISKEQKTRDIARSLNQRVSEFKNLSESQIDDLFIENVLDGS